MASRPGDFTKTTKEVLAGRAGYECSNPVCSKRTAAPGSTGTVANLGKAAHIIPASPGGARGKYHKTLTMKDLKDPSNGVWLCSDCATMIDLTDGADYPPFVLRAWRELQETTAALNTGGTARRSGWVHRVEVDGTRFMPPGSYQLGPATVVTGPSPSGKSALVALVTARGTDQVMTWQIHGTFSYELQWFAPHLHRLEVDVQDVGHPAFRVDGRAYRLPPSPVRTVELSFQGLGALDSVDKLAKTLEVSSSDVAALAPALGTHRLHPNIQGGAVDAEVLRVDTGNEQARGRALAMLSGGEQAAVALELALARAEALATTGPVLLVIDPWPTILNQHQETYLRALTAHAGRIQILATALELPSGVDWSGWAHLDFAAAPPTDC